MTFGLSKQVGIATNGRQSLPPNLGLKGNFLLTMFLKLSFCDTPQFKSKETCHA